MKTYWIAASVVMALELVAVADVRAQATPKDMAQTYPNRPVRIIVPFPPGGGVDLTNRILSSRLTVAESGIPGFEVTAWYGSCVPAAVPRPILEKLNAAVVKTINLPEIRERYVQTSLEVTPSTRDEFAAFIKGEIAKWRKVAQTAGISLVTDAANRRAL